MVFKKKTKNFKTLTCLYFLLSFFVSLFLNLWIYEGRAQDQIFFQIELSDGISQDVKNSLEEKILEFKNVKKVRFISRDENIKALEDTLKISLPNSALSDTMVVYLYEKESMEEIINQLEENEKILGIFTDNEYIDRNIVHQKIFRMMKYMVLILFIAPTIFGIFSAFFVMRERNLLYYYFTSKDREGIYSISKKSSLLPMLFSGIVGILIYVNIYFLIQKNFVQLDYYHLRLAPEVLLLVLGVAVVVISGISYLLPFSQENKLIEDNYHE